MMENKIGLVKKPVRFREGKKIAGKSNAKNMYMFVEFEDIQSVPIFTKLINKGSISYLRKSYRAGTNTYVHIRRSKRK